MVELKDFELKINGMDCPSCAMNQGDGKNILKFTRISSSAHVIKSGFFQR